MSKIAILRYMELDGMLRSRQRPYPKMRELQQRMQDKFGVSSVSTVEKDLYAMRNDFGAPIVYDYRHRGYCYEDTGFRLFGVNLSEDNLEALQLVEGMLEGMGNLPIFNQFSDAVEKVLDALALTRQFGSSERPLHSFLQVHTSPYVKSSEALPQLIAAARDRRVVRIHYQKFQTAHPEAHTLHPYLIREYNDLWYVTGFSQERDAVRTFGIDRIRMVEACQATYLPPEGQDFDPETHFRHCVGMTVLEGAVPQEIRLRFSLRAADYVKAAPIHPSQQVLAEDGEGCLIGLYLIDNTELRNWVQGFGAEVEVIAPASLREHMRRQAERLAKCYLQQTDAS